MTSMWPPRHIVWSTDKLDLEDSFQRKWYICQVIEHGRAEDVARLDLGELASLLPELGLTPYLYSLWARFLEARHAAGERSTPIASTLAHCRFRRHTQSVAVLPRRRHSAGGVIHGAPAVI